MGFTRSWLAGLPSEGRYTFTTEEAAAELGGLSRDAVYLALARARRDRLLYTPARGFWVVVPPEYRPDGAPPWRWFLDPLMTHLRLPYYVGILTAAAHHGASGQAAQVVTVVTARPRAPILAGRARVEFAVRRTTADAPIEPVTTDTGHLRVATAELVCLDLVAYPARAGGWGNVATIIRDLGGKVRAQGMRHALRVRPATTEVQRLGFLLDRAGLEAPAKVLAGWLANRSRTYVPFLPNAGRAGPRIARWRVIENSVPVSD